jgi:urease accessory protein
MRMDREDWLPFVLQTSDASFPTGAYAHSSGLEELVRLGVVKDQETLGGFFREQVEPALADLELPYLWESWEAAGKGDVDALCAIDREIHAWKLAEESRTASIQVGLRRLAMVEKWNCAGLATLFREKVETGRAWGHQLTVLGIQAAAGGTPLRATLFCYVYSTFAGYCGAALKLIRIGQEGCQVALREALGRAGEIVDRSLEVDRSTAGNFSPMLEIAALRHARAWERLFIS